MSNAVESAIINLVIQGAGAVGSATDRIEADLTSVERSGKRAETASAAADKAARDAERASRELVAGATQALSRLAGVASFARQAVHALGSDSPALNVLGAGLSGAASGAALGGGSFGPAGALLGAVGGGLISAGNAYRTVEDNTARASAERDKLARETAAKVVEELGKAQMRDVDRYLKDQGEYSRMAHALGGQRSVQ